MFELIGESPDVARANTKTVMEIETALAKASLTRVDKRDPYKLFHKMTLRQLETAAFAPFPQDRQARRHRPDSFPQYGPPSLS